MTPHERVPLRYLIHEVDERFGSDVLPLLSVSIRTGVQRRDELTLDEHRAESLDAYKRCRAGDVVLNRMRAFQGAIGVAPVDGLVSPDYAVLRAAPALDARYLAYLLRSKWGVAEMASRLRGIGGVSSGVVRTPRVNVDDLRTIRVPLPTLARQQAAVDALDRESQLVARTTSALIRLSDQLLAAFAGWFNGVVRGHPQVPLRRWMTSISDGPFGSSLASEHYVPTPGVRVLRLGDIGTAEIKDGSPAFVATDYANGTLAPYRVATGDLVMAGLGDANNSLGRASVVPAHLDGAIHKADCYRISLDSRRADGQYVAWALSFGPAQEEAPLLARGTTRSRLNTSLARELPVPQLTLDDQLALVQEAEQRRQRLRAASSQIDAIQARLNDYRDALITEYVARHNEGSLG